MALTSLLFDTIQSDGSKISGDVDELLIDAVLKESPTYSSNVTSHTIEDGSFISDHVIDEPLQLSLEGIITDTPVRLLSGVRDVIERGFGSASRSISAFELIKKLRDSHTILSVVTGLTVYKNMVITNFSVTRDNTTGKSLKFMLNLREISFVSLQEKERDESSIREVHSGMKKQMTSQTKNGKQSGKTPDKKFERKRSALIIGGQSLGLFK